MKITATNSTIKPSFRPIKLTIVLETAKEAEAFGTIFNYAPLVDAVAKAFKVSDTTLFEPIRRAVDAKGGEINSTSELSEALKTFMRF